MNLHDDIIAEKDLEPVSSGGVRRPIFFPRGEGSNSFGDYLGYTKGIPNDSIAANVIPTTDLNTLEKVSVGSASELIRRIAQAQTSEDNGGPEGVNGYKNDVDRIELAMRLRGIKDP